MRNIIEIEENKNHIKQALEEKIAKINELEKHFREVIRKKEHPNWKICRYKKRKYITKFGVFELNITMYEKKQENGKLKRFVYYHHDLLKQLSRQKYDFTIIEETIEAILKNDSLPTVNGKRIEPSTARFWMKKYAIEEKIINENNKLIEHFQKEKINKKNEQINIEIDDTYHKINYGKSKEKVRFRTAVFHTDFTNKDIKKKGVVLLEINEFIKGKEHTKKSSQYYDILAEKTSEFVHEESQILVKGDGARWIKNSILLWENSSFYLDKFHLIKKIKGAIGHQRNVSNPFKKVFQNLKVEHHNQYWYDVFLYVLENKNKDDFMKLKDDFLAVLEEKFNDKKLLNHVKELFRYIKNNENGIWDLDGKRKIVRCYTEHFMYYKCKKNIKKSHSFFGLNLTKLKIMYNNLVNGFATIFA
ncbi:UPF0236 family protein [Mycoplasma sp. Pen4]|uniref:Mbov_0401 family ICE element transposase-like protein n=1 Tax=Mycoplasma sp. Pen4 TaxID=640330 RepID=UPI0016547537|nr:UPF0236 family protein [Mycoplasma sp. Pen4]QNM93764.1 UPF0236 family protein [Mycoplasma sp. Pen4]QNM93860.1 UPF0236 family protein [Mycoplasma sp. Pen4]